MLSKPRYCPPRLGGMSGAEGDICKNRTTSPSSRFKGLRHSFGTLKAQPLPTLKLRVGLLTREENLKDVDNYYIIAKIMMVLMVSISAS